MTNTVDNPLTSQLNKTQHNLTERQYQKVVDLDITAWVTKEPVEFDFRTSGKQLNVDIGDNWGNLFDCAWFRFSASIPDEYTADDLVASIDISGELCIVDQDGIPVRALTTISSEFDRSLGEPGKKIIPLKELDFDANTIEFWADAGMNDLFGMLQDQGKIMEAGLAVEDKEITSLYYDIEFLIDLITHLSEFELKAEVNLEQVARFLNEFELDENTPPEKIRQLVDELFYHLRLRTKNPNLNITAIGHSHLDLAWLWPIRETKRKGVRTFATVLANMRNYPEYIYGASQPQLYQWIKKNEPEQYEQIKLLIEMGRIEILGALWVESDINLISGESIIRQVLYGQQFYREEFNQTVNYAWLPDTFGFTGSLPQILKHCGLNYFVTQKLSWNRTNKFPYHSFWWKGIDGTKILSHMLVEETYNSPALPRSVMKITSNYQQADISDQALMVYGIGDGGGGPGEEHLERLRRMSRSFKQTPVMSQRVDQFFKEWEQDAENFPTWDGELYLERHQGTYTTNAKNKWFNRKIEILLRNVEMLQSLLYINNHAAFTQLYDKKQLDSWWQEILLYQFHDILPGSSIKRVYDESLARYNLIYDALKIYQDTLLRRLYTSNTPEQGNSTSIIAFNSLAWQRTEWLKIDTNWYKITINGINSKQVDQPTNTDSAAFTYSQSSMMNNQISLEFGSDGSIRSICDIDQNRNVLVAPANIFRIYEDTGNAWDFPPEYNPQQPELMELKKVTTEVDGPKLIRTQTFIYENSELIQKIILTLDDYLIKFDTELNWNSPKKMLRTSFPVNVDTANATYDIQFGSMQRSTGNENSWEEAKIEVVGHKWVDLSTDEYGVSLLNDSKYGHKIKGRIIDINLLRSVPYSGFNTSAESEITLIEDEFTDIGNHHFKYALLPHLGDHIEADTVHRAYQFNFPLKCNSIKSNDIEPNFQFLQVSGDVILETVKVAEDIGGIIIRLYEPYGKPTQISLEFMFPLKKIVKVNAVEEIISEVKIDGRFEVDLEFTPYEIQTYKLII